jgi:predicted lipoprotein with Yx(FWY)xxD motif
MLRSLATLKAPHRRPWMLLALPATAAAALVVGCSSSGTSAGSSSGGSSGHAAPAAGSVKTATIGGATVLTNSKGFTLYSFAPDTPTTSKCTGSCITYWPPVKGPAAAGPGVTGKLATIKRSDGSVQATYNGHPLYTYVADTAPGQAKGNGLNLSGGVWHEVAASGTAAPAATTSAGSGGGY